jgi:hypothetical protein
MNYHSESPIGVRRSRFRGSSVKKSHNSRILLLQPQSEIAVLPTAASQLV